MPTRFPPRWRIGWRSIGRSSDSLHRWPDDLDLVAGLGLNCYRFSIEWARVEPSPGHFSRAMLGHYRRVIDGCLARSITPVVTLHHFTLPHWLHEAGGRTAPDAPALFARYARAVRPCLDGVEMATLHDVAGARRGYRSASSTRLSRR